MTLAIDVREAFRIHRLGGATSVALQGLTLAVEEGEIVVVLGPSGSGKTTLLRTVGGFDTLSAGVARVLGVDIGALGPGAVARFRAENLGLLDQHYARALSPDLTCVHTVGLGLELLGRPRREAREAASALLERVGLGDRLEARPGELSGGEQQRVALCAALAHRPRLLLADEPAGELDAANASLVYDLIQELAREQGTTALVVSHDEAAARIAGRLVYVRDGRVVEEGRPGERHSLVVTAPGWVRLPDPMLEALGSPTRLHAEAGDGEVVLSRDAVDRDLETPAPVMLHERATAAGDVVAELRNVVRRFERTVLPGISAEFRAGTLTAVVGRSGSGKTTLLHLLAGLDQPGEGQVVVAGQKIEGLDRADAAAVRRRRVALITQEPGLVPHLSARENVELGLLVRGLEGDPAAALTEVGLAARLDHRADRLSAGERQRVAIARALVARPVLLLADEPTARLDQSNARAVAELLRRLAHEHATAVVCATHDAVVIEQADAVIELVPGTGTVPGTAVRTSVPGTSGARH